MRGKREKTISTGTMRMPMTRSCSSRVWRSNCSRAALICSSPRVVWICWEAWASMAWVMTSSPTRFTRRSIFSVATRTVLASAWFFFFCCCSRAFPTASGLTLPISTRISPRGFCRARASRMSAGLTPASSWRMSPRRGTEVAGARAWILRFSPSATNSKTSSTSIWGRAVSRRRSQARWQSSGSRASRLGMVRRSGQLCRVPSLARSRNMRSRLMPRRKASLGASKRMA